MNTLGRPAAVELDDIQGLVRFGYKHHTEAIFLLLRVKDPAAARQWIAAAPVASAVTQEPLPPTVLQLAFTYPGLRALELPDDIAAAFSMEFVDGMSGNPNRSRRLGDIGPNDANQWEWGAIWFIPLRSATLDLRRQPGLWSATRFPPGSILSPRRAGPYPLAAHCS